MFEIIFEDVNKVYSNGTEALENISFTISQGEIICLAGPNSAGKTTILKLIWGSLKPTKGTVSYPSYIGFAALPQDARLTITSLTPYDYIVSYVLAYGYPLREAKRTAKQILSELSLESIVDKPVWTLSGGMRKRVLLAMTMAVNADVIILDEPTTGLDVLARKDFWSWALSRFSEKDKTLIFTTHHLEEAEIINSRALIINEGIKLADGSPRSITGAKFGTDKKVVVEEEIHDKFNGLISFSYTIGKRTFLFPFNDHALDEIINRVKTYDFSVGKTTLEDAFMVLIESEKNAKTYEPL